MNDKPYHQYLFFDVKAGFYQLPEAEQAQLKDDFVKWFEDVKTVAMIPYATQGFKPDATFVIWCRSAKPEALQEILPSLRRTGLGRYVKLRHTLFGMMRKSQYSRPGQENTDQVIREDERLPYLIIYPFTKTTDWYLLGFETRLALMKAHIKVGLGHPQIRQCLLYSYGVDDNEFIVSYETPSLEEFQDLVIELRSTEVRRYTENDQPTYTCIYKPINELMQWL